MTALCESLLEIQGCIALENSFNLVGLDHVILVKIASTAVVAEMLALSHEEIINALSLALQTARAFAPTPQSPTLVRARVGQRVTPRVEQCVWR